MSRLCPYAPGISPARLVGLLVLLAALAVPSAAFAQTETIEYYGTDAIGSIRIVWDANGNMTARQDFTPFGEPVLQQGTAIPKEGFVGNETDAETNQDYFHARMFEARTGRFTRPDPIDDGVGEPQRWNRYAYALNQPLMFADATGLDPCPPGTPAGVICVIVTPPPTPPPPPDPGGSSDTPPDVSTDPNYNDPCLTPMSVGSGACQNPVDGPGGAGQLPGKPKPLPLPDLPSIPQITKPTPTIGPQRPAARLTPNPPKGPQRVTRTCFMGAVSQELFNGSDKAETTVGVNVILYLAIRKALPTFIPGPGWLWGGAAAIYDADQVAQGYRDCAYGDGGPGGE